MLDGHEGEAAVEHAAQQLPVAVAQQLARFARCGRASCRLTPDETCKHQFTGFDSSISLYSTSDCCGLSCCRSGSLSDDSIEAALRLAVATTDAAFLQRAAAQGLGDGTTAVFALLRGQRFLVGSIGDSFAILCGRNASCAASRAQHGQTPAAGSVTAARPASEAALSAATAAANTAAGTAAAAKAEPQQEVRAEVLSALHSPGRQDEKQRIEAAGGWVKTTAGQLALPCAVNRAAHLRTSAADRTENLPSLNLAIDTCECWVCRWAAATFGRAHDFPRHRRLAIPQRWSDFRAGVHNLAHYLSRWIFFAIQHT